MAMTRLPIEELEYMSNELKSILSKNGIESIVVSNPIDLADITQDQMPDLVLVEFQDVPSNIFEECIKKCTQLKLPKIALIPINLIHTIDISSDIDDFIITPIKHDELVARASSVIKRRKSPNNTNLIQIDNLVINPTNFVVLVDGQNINLRFKEYELLLLMARNPGRVYTRESLLNQIWGYDYIGGTRTVDVHIRRLRSKIENMDHPLIETVWNVGYRIRATKNILSDMTRTKSQISSEEISR